MIKCVFCGREAYEHTGIHLITNIGVINFYCSSKCRKNATKLGRDKRKVRWTESYRLVRTKGIEQKEAQEKAAAN